MTRRRRSPDPRGLLALGLSLSTLALAQSPRDFSQWEETYQFECNGPWAHFSPPDVRTVGAFRYEHTGATLKLRRVAPRRPGPVRVGVLAGIKDLEPDTRALLERFLADFERADVDVIIVGGDTAEEPDVLDQVYGFLVGATQRPLYAIAGNTERAAALTYAISKQRKAGHLQLLNGDLIRRLDGDGFDLVSLAGYYDRRYLHLSGGCIYDDQALRDAEAAAQAADDPVIFVSHGPPRMRGQKAIDYVPGADNVGDPRLTELLKRAKIRFGVFGHIIEAGGRATDLAGHPVPPDTLLPSLYLDQGSANPLPWKMNDGKTSWGLAAILTVQGQRVSYHVLRGPKPAPRTP